MPSDNLSQTLSIDIIFWLFDLFVSSRKTYNRLDGGKNPFNIILSIVVP